MPSADYTGTLYAGYTASGTYDPTVVGFVVGYLVLGTLGGLAGGGARAAVIDLRRRGGNRLRW